MYKRIIQHKNFAYFIYLLFAALVLLLFGNYVAAVYLFGYFIYNFFYRRFFNRPALLLTGTLLIMAGFLFTVQCLLFLNLNRFSFINLVMILLIFFLKVFRYLLKPTKKYIHINIEKTIIFFF